MPPSAANAIKITLTRGDKLSPTRMYCAPQLANIAPIIICPSTPIFHKPARKVTTKPMLTRVRGIQKLTTLPNARIFESAFPEGVDDFQRVASHGRDEGGCDGQQIITGMSRKAICTASDFVGLSCFCAGIST